MANYLCWSNLILIIGFHRHPIANNNPLERHNLWPRFCLSLRVWPVLTICPSQMSKQSVRVPVGWEQIIMIVCSAESLSLSYLLFHIFSTIVLFYSPSTLQQCNFLSDIFCNRSAHISESGLLLSSYYPQGQSWTGVHGPSCIYAHIIGVTMIHLLLFLICSWYFSIKSMLRSNVSAMLY